MAVIGNYVHYHLRRYTLLGIAKTGKEGSHRVLNKVREGNEGINELNTKFNNIVSQGRMVMLSTISQQSQIALQETVNALNKEFQHIMATSNQPNLQTFHDDFLNSRQGKRLIQDTLQHDILPNIFYKDGNKDFSKFFQAGKAVGTVSITPGTYVNKERISLEGISSLRTTLATIQGICNDNKKAFNVEDIELLKENISQMDAILAKYENKLQGFKGKKQLNLKAKVNKQLGDTIVRINELITQTLFPTILSKTVADSRGVVGEIAAREMSRYAASQATKDVESQIDKMHVVETGSQKALRSVELASTFGFNVNDPLIKAKLDMTFARTEEDKDKGKGKAKGTSSSAEGKGTYTYISQSNRKADLSYTVKINGQKFMQGVSVKNYQDLSDVHVTSDDDLTKIFGELSKFNNNQTFPFNAFATHWLNLLGPHREIDMPTQESTSGKHQDKFTITSSGYKQARKLINQKMKILAGIVGTMGIGQTSLNAKGKKTAKTASRADIMIVFDNKNFKFKIINLMQQLLSNPNIETLEKSFTRFPSEDSIREKLKQGLEAFSFPPPALDRKKAQARIDGMNLNLHSIKVNISLNVKPL